MWKGVESEEDILEWRGFQDGMDLHLGAICSLSEREKERERETEKHNHNRVPTKEKKKGYVCMKNAWTCDVLKEMAS